MLKLILYTKFSASGGASTWGSITGTLSDQTDLQAALDDKQSISNYNNNFLLMGG